MSAKKKPAKRASGKASMPMPAKMPNMPKNTTGMKMTGVRRGK